MRKTKPALPSAIRFMTEQKKFLLIKFALQNVRGSERMSRDQTVESELLSSCVMNLFNKFM